MGICISDLSYKAKTLNQLRHLRPGLPRFRHTANRQVGAKFRPKFDFRPSWCLEDALLTETTGAFVRLEKDTLAKWRLFEMESCKTCRRKKTNIIDIYIYIYTYTYIYITYVTCVYMPYTKKVFSSKLIVEMKKMISFQIFMFQLTSVNTKWLEPASCCRGRTS